MTNILSNRFKELVEQAQQVESSTDVYGTEGYLDSALLLNWTVKVKSLISNACGIGSQHFMHLTQAEKTVHYPASIENLVAMRAVLLASQEDYDGGYAGLNFRDLAEQVGIKAASIYYYFPSKADLATAVAKRYWENASAYLESLLQNSAKPLDALRRYPETFRWALRNDNRICLCSFMSAQFDDLPDQLKTEVQAFANVNVAWLKKTLIASKVVTQKEAEKRASAIYSGIVGAQLMARSRADITLYDSLIDTYRTAGLLPA